MRKDDACFHMVTCDNFSRWITPTFRVNQALKISWSFVCRCIIHVGQSMHRKSLVWFFWIYFDYHGWCIYIHVGWSWNFRTLIYTGRWFNSTIEMIICDHIWRHELSFPTSHIRSLFDLKLPLYISIYFVGFIYSPFSLLVDTSYLQCQWQTEISGVNL